MSPREALGLVSLLQNLMWRMLVTYYVFHYLAGTSNCFVVMDVRKLDIVGFCDSDWIDDQSNHWV